MSNSEWPDNNETDWDDLSEGNGSWGEEKRPPNSRGKWLFLIVALLVVIGLVLIVRARGGGDLDPPSASVAESTQAVTDVPPSPVPTVPATLVTTPLPLSPTPLPPTPEPQTQTSAFPLKVLQQQMLQLINDARLDSGLSPVLWDPVAEEIGMNHAEDMIAQQYFSHVNLEGLGPDHRNTLGGGRHAVSENLHAFVTTFPDGRGAPIEDWSQVIENAHQGLMESEGHRANILDPARTHLGVGMAYNAIAGQFVLAQEFSNQYVIMAERLPIQAALGTAVTVEGVIPGDNISNVLLDLAYEPFPKPLTIEQVNGIKTYISSANSVTTQRISPNFIQEIILDADGQPGIYHIRIFADIDGNQTLLVDHAIWVGGNNV